jgi:hypothetical protein
VFSDYEEDCRCFEWESTKGIIVNTYVSTEQMIDNNGLTYIMYKPNIIYEYIVDGVKYTGKNIVQYKTFSKEKNIVENYLSNYNNNKTIEIEYTRNWPKNSVMIDGLGKKDKLLLNIIALSLFIIGVVGLIFLFSAIQANLRITFRLFARF